MAEREIKKLLIANRGEIAVRIIRAAKDSGIQTVAVYAGADRDAQHVQLADEAYSLDGETAAETYLVIEKLLGVARRSGANAVHPGYGFLSENAQFAKAVVDAGLIWVGPPASAIERLGDKLSARQVAEKVGAPLAPGTKNPVASVSEVEEFVNKHGLPVAIKAAYGGGGRGIKVVKDKSEIKELFDSATREAVAAFGRGECFIEKYLEKPRHVETQCLADEYGNVVVISTRDCSLQRRHQKLVEEAPAPFLSDAQTKELYEASKKILKEVGYVGAGTCEFLVARDGTISFLEVNTRLQVEHPVSEEVTGIDLVREQFRIAEGAKLEYQDPEINGHSIEFRINGEDPGRNFLPSPGPIHLFLAPSGPGIRVDSGVLQEMQVHGLPTVLPFHRLIVSDPAFTADKGSFDVHTRWIETEWSNPIEPWSGQQEQLPASTQMKDLVVEVEGKRLTVSVPRFLVTGESSSIPKIHRRKKTHQASTHTGAKGNSLLAPMQATVVKLAVSDGQMVQEGELVVVLEAMKMEQPLTAHRAGKIANVGVSVGATISAGTRILDILD